MKTILTYVYFIRKAILQSRNHSTMWTINLTIINIFFLWFFKYFTNIYDLNQNDCMYLYLIIELSLTYLFKYYQAVSWDPKYLELEQKYS